MIYQAPVRDMRYLLHDVLEVTKYSNVPGFADVTPDLTDAILEEGAKLTQEVMFPLNQSGDEEGCHFDKGKVTPPKGFKEAYDAFKAGGWASLTCEPEHGGQGMPNVVGIGFMEMMISSNLSLATYPGLTRGAYEAIKRSASQELKMTYLPKMASGEWGGTMNLTEPHCGTDLGLIRTKAEPQADGTFKITGTKIFISAGEHDMSDNIIHLVLARITGAPEGVRGISLFVVPKLLLNPDGTPGKRNSVTCGSIEKKMGIKGSATCVMNYDDAVGYLVGEKGKGMRAMFVMMNEARIGVGMQGVGLSELAYQNAANYAKERLQGRSLVGTKYPDKAADPIIVHPDVRRMLLTMRAFNEGARAFAMWTALHADLSERHPDESVRRDAEDLLALMTPIVKCLLTDMGFETINLGVQCFGGHGYIREHGMEQIVRDARITQLYEGTSGIQALDLVGRKLPQHAGRLLRQFFHPVDQFIQSNMNEPQLGDLVTDLAKSFARLQQATAWVAEQGMKDPLQAGSGASDYLRLFGLVALGYMWCLMAKVSLGKLANGAEDKDFHRRKVSLAQFYMKKMLPDTSALLSKIMAGADTLMALEDDAF
ncbi:MAG: acyl-CoA dehydrogenase [Alphaproteobacteria bacterium]|nr:acyl-CoA dehydrogenase [Alphaproteobacteria bacterium]